MAGQISGVRRPAVAGTWYPGTRAGLRQTVEKYLAGVPPVSLPGQVLALVSPHAGYQFSAATAAHAYACLRGSDFTRVILVGPLHRPIPGSRLGPYMIPTESTWATPLGDVPIDRAFIAQLDQEDGLTPVSGDHEHALEAQLPFLQVVLDTFSLVPILLGEYVGEPGVLGRLNALAIRLASMADERTLLVVSTDLSHLHDYGQVVAQDRRLAELLEALNTAGLTGALVAGEVQACGAAGLVLALAWAQARGARSAHALAYAASGDITGDKRPGTYTVGYLAAAICR